MVYVNKLDVEGLKKLGICFKTDEEMERFARVVKADLELRVGEAISSTLSKDQIKDFEKTPDSEQPMWIKENCPQYKEIHEKVYKAIKEELFRYRFYIPGNKGSIGWEIISIDELDLLPMRYHKLLKKHGIYTIGELYSVDDANLAYILNIYLPAEKESRIKEIRNAINKFIDDVLSECCYNEYD